MKCVNISRIYFLLVINTIINIRITTPKKQLKYIHFNEQHFSSSKSSINVLVITTFLVIRVKTFIYIANKIRGLKRPIVTVAAAEYFQWGKREIRIIQYDNVFSGKHGQ